MISEKYKDLYLTTARGQIKKLSNLLLYLEKKPGNQNLIENIFRLIHSMKGAAATMGYKKTVNLFHSMENIIDAAYNNELEINKKIINLFFSTIDVLDKNFNSIQKISKEINLTKNIKLFGDILNRKSSKSKGKKLMPKKEKHILGSLPSVAEISVSTDKLDKIQNLLDDMLINAMEIKSRVKQGGDANLLKLCVASDKILSDLRRQLEKVRIVPLSQVLSSLPYLVREIARDEDKEVELIINDNNLSLDKAILDELVEILIQLIKNAVSHGISNSQKKGLINIDISLVDDKLAIKVEDNGVGINWQDILDLAVKNKIVTRQVAKKMTLEKIKDLIFRPGISKGKTLSTTSGRGVGLSLVKNKVIELDGQMEIISNVKKGTSFVITIPQPLSVFRSIMFRVLDYSVAIPLAQIDDIVKLEDIKDFSKQKYFTYKKLRYKMSSLGQIFSVKGLDRFVKYVILITYQGKKIAVPLASNIDEDELIMKKQPLILKNNKYIKGVAISAKGQPVLVFDINNLV